MSDEKKYTERDLVLAKREGWVHCANVNRYPYAYAERVAAGHYPLPKITRQRRIFDANGVEWRITNGVMEYSVDGHRWKVDAAFNTPELTDAMRDLLANPTEEVDDA